MKFCAVAQTLDVRINGEGLFRVRMTYSDPVSVSIHSDKYGMGTRFEVDRSRLMCPGMRLARTMLALFLERYEKRKARL